MSLLGQVLLTTDETYAASAWVCPLADSDEQRVLLRAAPGLVLQQEGLIRDLTSAGNRQVRRNLGFAVGDRVVLKFLVSPEMWWAIHFNLDLLATELLAEDIELNQVDVATALAEGWEEVTVGDKKSVSFTLYMTAERTDSTRFTGLRAARGVF